MANDNRPADTAAAGEHSELLARIAQEAQEEASLLIAAAEKEAAVKKSQAQTKASQIKDEAVKRAETQIAAMAAHTDSLLAMEKKRALLAAQEKRYEAVIAMALAKVREAAGTNDYPDTVLGWLAEAGAGIGTEEAVVQGGSEEHTLLTSEFLAKAEKKIQALTGASVSLTKGSAPCQGQGIIVTAPGGRLAWDNRVQVRLIRMEQDIRKVLSHML
ncbi:MAG: V-type ATP synthase subunit E [Spirochaetales bacterium]|nr:V-type ATP synthase subunit E [Spirochaetales bacterium]